MLQNSHHQLQRGEAVYNFYALIVTTRYISGRYVSEEVVRINFSAAYSRFKGICLAMVYVAKFSSPITAWSGSVQFLCTHCYDPVHIRKIRIRRSRARKFSATYSQFKGSSTLLFGIMKLSIPLAVNELIGSCYFA